MNKIVFALVAALSLGVPSIAAAQSAPQVQSPCREAGHAGEQACVVVYKQVSGNQPTTHAALDTSVSKSLQGKAQKFSVIYAYRVRGGGDNSDIGLMINHGRSSMMADVYSNKARQFWVSTRDGGKTWSKLTTTDMDSVIAF